MAKTQDTNVREFEVAIVEYRRAAAELAEGGGKVSDDEIDNALDRFDRAVRSLVAIPAPRRVDLWFKIGLLEEEMTYEATVGERSDCRRMMILGAIKADLAGLGII